MSSAPSSSLQSLLKVSCVNGWSVTVVAGLSLLVTLLIGDWVGVLVSALVIVAGVFELRGHGLLTQDLPCAGRLLMAAQWLLMSVLFGYCLWQLSRIDPSRVLGSVPADSRRALETLGYSESNLSSLVSITSVALYGGVMLASLLHQGGLLYFYRRQIGKHARASTPPPIPQG